MAGRVLVECIFNLIGVFNFFPLLLTSQKKVVAFQAYSVHLAQFYQTIIPQLTGEPQLEILFIILPHPHFSRSSRHELKRFIQTKLNIPNKNIKQYWQILWQRFDVIICTDVYAKFPFRQTNKILLKHGAGLLKRSLMKHPLRKTIDDFDLCLLNGKYDLELIKRFSSTGAKDSKLVCLGFPYLDRLKSNSTDRRSYLETMGLDPGKKTILFAPSWRRLSRFHEEYEEFVNGMVRTLETDEFNIVIKLHACSFNQAMTAGLDWQQRLRAYTGEVNVSVDVDVDDVPALQHSEVLVTDVSSRAFNFMLLGKPIILFVSKAAIGDEFDRERVEYIQQCAFTATRPLDVKNILTDLNLSPAMRTRAKILSQNCFTNYGNATDEFVNLVIRQIGM